MMRLQGVGLVETKPIRDLKIGNKVYFNYGFAYDVVGIGKETKTQRSFSLKSEKGDIFERRFNKNKEWAYK
jgi:hypothetical protein